MPHDKKGRPIKVGDVIAFKGYDGQRRIGVVGGVVPGTSTCNLDVGVAAQRTVVEMNTVTAADAELVAKSDGSPADA